MFTHLKFTALAVVATAVLISTGCKSQPAHPNQLNTFDGATYDSLTLAHGALASLRVQISTSYPKYAPLFNEAEVTYSTAYEAYSLYRVKSSNQAQISVAISNLAVAIAALENAFQSDLHVAPKVILDFRHRALVIRTAAGQNISISDILTALEIAAAVAQTVPPAAPYAALATIVIEATQQALAAQSAASGQPIDLSTIQPLAPIQ
ncbi:MAG: hypothetical protein JO097_19435 [Acidobacteriaceae bacterium]|nr:hypothetical protein [Acidobacteriaceae bacterium]MBV9294101.1 hypothetical protein [Acidobacteriaceae bacterium]MBV9766515.1 hypothetical protein [Acidobacteriaceae bacterium]